MKTILLLLGLSTVAAIAQTDPLLFPGASAPYVQNLRESVPGPDGKGTLGGNLRKALGTRGVGMVFLPAGTYILDATLPVNKILRGEGPEKTVIRLNPPPATTKFGKTTALRLTAGARLEHLTIEVNSSEPEVCGVFVEESAELVDVVIRSIDGKGSAGIVIGSDERQNKDALGSAFTWMKDVKITGFPVGILVRGTATLLTAEGVMLTGQSGAGIKVDGSCVSLRSFKTIGPSSAIVGDADSLVVVDGAECKGQEGAKLLAAFKSAGQARVMGFKTEGYARALDLAGAPAGLGLEDWSSGDIVVRGGGASTKIAWKEIPASPNFSFDQWLAVDPANAPDFTTISWGKGQVHPDFSAALQKACAAGKPVVYFPPGQKYGFFGTASIAPEVRLIDGLFGGFFEVFHGSGTRYSGEIVVGDGKEPLEIRNLTGRKANLTIRHTGSRPLVLKSVDSFTYVGSDGAGSVFMESCSPSQITLGKGQELQATALDMSNSRGSLILNRGGTARIAGLRTNRWTTLVECLPGSKTEVLGAMVIASTLRPKDPLFIAAPTATLSASVAEWPVFEVAYDRLVADPAGKVLLKRGEAPQRHDETDSERVNGSLLPHLEVGP